MKNSVFCAAVFGMVLFNSAAVHAAGFAGLQLKSSQSWNMSHSTSYAFSRDAQAQAGDLTVAVTSLNMTKEYKFENGMPLDLGVDVQQYFINDTTTVDLPPSLQRKGLTAGVKFPMPFVEGEHWFMGVSTGAYFQTAQEHAFPSAAFRSKNRVYGIYKSSDDFILVGGFGYNVDYEDLEVVPLIGIKYKFNDQWTLNALSTNPNLAYQVDEKTELRLEAFIYRDEFEVSDGARKGDVIKVSDYRAGFGISHELSEEVSIGANVGWALAGRYEYLHNGGKVALDNGAYVAYNVSWKF